MVTKDEKGGSYPNFKARGNEVMPGESAGGERELLLGKVWAFRRENLEKVHFRVNKKSFHPTAVPVRISPAAPLRRTKSL